MEGILLVTRLSAPQISSVSALPERILVEDGHRDSGRAAILAVGPPSQKQPAAWGSAQPQLNRRPWSS